MRQRWNPLKDLGLENWKTSFYYFSEFLWIFLKHHKSLAEFIQLFFVFTQMHFSTKNDNFSLYLRHKNT